MKRSIRLKEWGVNICIEKTPSLEYASIRDSCEIKPYKITTDGQGFIVSGNDYRKLDATGLYVFIGDSFVESMFIDENNRFHSLLERKLWKSERKFLCLNGGYSGANSLHLINIVLNKVVPLRPKTVFYVIPSNDALSLSVDSGVWGTNRIVSPFIPHDSAFQKVSFNLRTVRSLIKSVHEVLAGFGINVVFMSFPHRRNGHVGKYLKERFKSKSHYLNIVKKRESVNLVLRNYCSRRKCNFIDLEELISPFELYSQDDLHLNEEGSNYFSDFLYSSSSEND